MGIYTTWRSGNCRQKKNSRKNRWFFLPVLLVLLSGCKSDEELPFLEVSATEIKFTKEAGEQTVNISSNVAWQSGITPASAASWLTVSPGSGTGSGTVAVSVKANDGYDNRTASVTFQSAGGVQTLQVTQWQSDAIRLTGKNEYAVWQPGATLPVAIEKNVEYTVEFSTGAQTWIHPAATKALVSEQLAFDIDENTTETQRYGEIYLKGKASGSGSVTPELTDTVKVFQQELALDIDNEAFQFGPYVQKKWLTVTSTHQYYPDASDNSFTASDYTYTLSDGAAAWCTVEKYSDNTDYLSVSVKENTTDEPRSAVVTITSSALSRTVRVEQEALDPGTEYYNDKDTLWMMRKSAGNIINLIIMGDGFTKADLKKGGLYERTMREAARHFFSIEPFNTYRNYFNVYAIIVESEEEGVNDSTTPNVPRINNRLKSTIGEGTSITWDTRLCAEYIHIALSTPLGISMVGSPDGSVYINSELLTILVLNTPRYAGTTLMYSNGYCVAACPMSTQEAPYDFAGLIHHEAGGHGFGLFEDEYVYSETTIPDENIKQIKQWQQKAPGFYQNVDFNSNITQTRWKDFDGIGKYSYVGTYPGACTYRYGIWRPEEISCMDSNIPYYSAPCRYSITKRIKRLARESQPNIIEFADGDHVTPPSGTKSGVPYRTMPPLGRPRMIEVN